VRPQLFIPVGARPEIGRSYTLDYQDVAYPSSPATLMIGASNAQWGMLQLPFDLTPFGAPGCLVLQSNDLGITIPYATGGVRTVVVNVPPDAVLIGADLYQQAVALNPANQLGVLTSNGVHAVIGG